MTARSAVRGPPRRRRAWQPSGDRSALVDGPQPPPRIALGDGGEGGGHRGGVMPVVVEDGTRRPRPSAPGAAPRPRMTGGRPRSTQGPPPPRGATPAATSPFSALWRPASRMDATTVAAGSRSSPRISRLLSPVGPVPQRPMTTRGGSPRHGRPAISRSPAAATSSASSTTATATRRPGQPSSAAITSRTPSSPALATRVGTAPPPSNRRTQAASTATTSARSAKTSG